MISINWLDRIINIPRADLTLKIASPETRELDLHSLHSTLKILETTASGIFYPDTHTYSHPTNLVGEVYADYSNDDISMYCVDNAGDFQFINSYTVTFENGNYIVDVVSGSNNLDDVLNPNNVTVNSNLTNLIQVVDIYESVPQ